MSLVALVGAVSLIAFSAGSSHPAAAGDELAVLSAPQGDGDGQGGASAEKQYSAARAAVGARQWARAAALTREVLTLEPNHEGARHLQTKIEAESRADASYSQALLAVSENRWSDAWNSLQEVQTDSTYHAQARSLLEQVKAALIKAKLDQANDFIDAGEWDSAESLVDEVAGLDAENEQIEGLRSAIDDGRANAAKTRAASRSTPTRKTTKREIPRQTPPTPPPAPVQKPVVMRPPPQPEGITESPKDLYLEGAKLLKAEQYSKAVEKFNKCVLTDSRYALCYRALGIAYAYMKNGPKAARFYRLYLKVDPEAHDAEQVRQFLRDYEAVAE